MESVKPIRALSRGLSVLRLLEDHGPLSLHMLGERTRLPKASLGRILKTLEKEGFVRRGLSDRLYYRSERYRGERTASSETARRTSMLVEVAAPILDRLCQEVLWASDLAILHDGAMVIQETTRRLSPFVMDGDVLNRRIHVLPSALGLAFLAYCPPAPQGEVLARLAASPDPYDRPAKNRAKLMAQLEAIRRRGYAVRAPGYPAPHGVGAKLSAIAVPVLAAGEDGDEGAIAAINLVWINSAADVATFAAQHLHHLQETARSIGAALQDRLTTGSV